MMRLIIVAAGIFALGATTTFLVPENNATGTLASDLALDATTLTLETGDGANFPSTFPYRIVIDAAEVVEVTARTGDTMTVTRAQEGTSATAHLDGVDVVLAVTAGYIEELQDAINALESGTNPPAGVVTNPMGDDEAAEFGDDGDFGIVFDSTAVALEVEDGDGNALLTLEDDGTTGTLTVTEFVGDLTGDVAGNVTGDVTGDLTGDSAGTHTGSVALGTKASITAGSADDVSVAWDVAESWLQITPNTATASTVWHSDFWGVEPVANTGTIGVRYSSEGPTWREGDGTTLAKMNTEGFYLQAEKALYWGNPASPSWAAMMTAGGDWELQDGDGNTMLLVEDDGTGATLTVTELVATTLPSGVLLETELDTEAELEALLTDVTNVYTNNDTVPVVDGGTGAGTAGDARTNLGLVIGTNVQAYDAGLADVAGLEVTDGNVIVGDGTNWVAESGATARTSLGLGSAATRAAEDTLTNGSNLPDGAAVVSYVASQVSGDTDRTFDDDVAALFGTDDDYKLLYVSASDRFELRTAGDDPIMAFQDLGDYGDAWINGNLSLGQLGADEAVNGDCESGFTSGLADGWEKVSVVTTTDETTEVYEGSHSQKVVYDGVSSGYVGIEFPEVTVDEGVVYEVSFAIKVESISGVTLKAQYYAPSVVWVDIPGAEWTAATDGWRKVYATLQPSNVAYSGKPATPLTIRVAADCGMGDSFTIYLDSYEVREIENGSIHVAGDAEIGGNLTLKGDFASYAGDLLLRDDRDLVFGDNSDIQMRYDEAGENRLEWHDGTNTLAHLTDNGTTGTFYASALTGATGSFTSGCTVSGTNGFDAVPSGDADCDLLTVGVTGTPKLWWDESEDYFVLSNDLFVTNTIDTRIIQSTVQLDLKTVNAVGGSRLDIESVPNNSTNFSLINVNYGVNTSGTLKMSWYDNTAERAYIDMQTGSMYIDGTYNTFSTAFAGTGEEALATVRSISAIPATADARGFGDLDHSTTAALHRTVREERYLNAQGETLDQNAVDERYREEWAAIDERFRPAPEAWREANYDDVSVDRPCIAVNEHTAVNSAAIAELADRLDAALARITELERRVDTLEGAEREVRQ